MNHLRLFFIIFTFWVTACTSNFHLVHPAFETDPVDSTDDAADDPCIFIHSADPTKSSIIGTDKQKGLVVYDVHGKIRHQYNFGRINNVDIRQEVPWGDTVITVVGGSNRTDNSVVFYQLNEEDVSLHPLHSESFTSKVDEVYGFCLYLETGLDKVFGFLYAFVVGKDGQVEQWALSPTPSGDLSAKVVRQFDVGGQCEGMVVDDELHQLYIGEEEVGIWKYSAYSDEGDSRKKVQAIAENKSLKADIEGLTIYKGWKDGEGYLIASSQGNNSYAVYTRGATNEYLGSFKIKSLDGVDGTSDTDGIDVCSRSFGPQFPKGIFVVQDGKNKGATQNFKVVDWREIQKMVIEEQ